MYYLYTVIVSQVKIKDETSSHFFRFELWWQSIKKQFHRNYQNETVRNDDSLRTAHLKLAAETATKASSPES